MDVGIILPVEGDRAWLPLLAAVARGAELLQFHSIRAAGRLLTPRRPPRDYAYSSERGAIAFPHRPELAGAITVMGLVTGLTSTIRIGTNVLAPSYRHPVVRAQEHATMPEPAAGLVP